MPNRTSRRRFIATASAAALIPPTVGPALSIVPAPGSSRAFRLHLGNRDHHHLVYNHDGYEPFYRVEGLAPISHILQASVGFFRGTPVNIYDFHFTKTILHDLDIEKQVGPSMEPPYASSFYWRAHENVRHHLRKGVDPIAEIIKATRAAGATFFAGIRTNDVHHPASGDHPKFWLDHPEYRINEPVAWDERASGALNYAHQAVRDHYKGHVAAVLERYDVDGVEVDFNRSPIFFKAGAVDQRRDTLTAHLRGIRDLVEQASNRRGHRIYLLARVPSVLRQCHRHGMDVVRWIREEIVDIAVCAPVRYAEFEMPVEEFVEAAQDRKVLVFAGFEHIFTEDGTSLLTPEMLAAAATHYWKTGVDGLHLFGNHYFYWRNLPEPHLKVIASPEVLARVDKEYQLTRLLKGVTRSEKGGFNDLFSYPKQLPVDLRPGQTTAVRIFMDDALEQRPVVQLRLRLDGLTPPDAFTVTLNGHRLSDLRRSPYSDRGIRLFPDGSYESGQSWQFNTQWAEASIKDLSWMREGVNVVEVTLERRNEMVASPLVLSNVEFELKYY